MEKVHLTKEKETMLISLYSRALHSRTENPVLYDKWAEDAVNKIDYDFASIKLNKFHPLSIAIRAKQFDIFAKEWIEKNPISQVLHLGCGLDSRVFRVNPSPDIQWFDIDYPEVIELRKQLYPERENYRTISTSLLDYKWFDEISTELPTLVLAEGVMMYLPAESGREFIGKLTNHLKSGQMAFDAMNKLGVKIGGSEKAVNATGARFGWYINNPNDITQYAPKMELLAELSSSKFPDWKRFPLMMRLVILALEPFSLLRRLNRILLYNFQ
jgi:O-methyltransferase involved in polyketide biosynthesis